MWSLLLRPPRHLRPLQRHVRRLAHNRQTTKVQVPKFATVSNLATLFKVRFVDLQATMKNLGYSNFHWDYIVDDENACLIADELGVPAQMAQNHGEELYPQPLPKDIASCPPRPPVVALMGHVDHGKTTLLDYFRKSHIADGEKGGITQHIGAFLTKVGDQPICFLDTPGHEAFLKLRQRGAHLTDIVMLVVSAEDSVMPQTIEALKHAKAAGVPLLVALTKSDRPDANPARVVADLARNGVDVEDYGGETQCIPVSAVTGKGIPDLQAALQALIEIQDVRSPAKGLKAEGVIVEASVAKGSGNAASMIVRKGTLRPRQVVVAGSTWCRVRQLSNEFGKPLKEAPPGTPVRVSGWKELPEPGDIVLEAKDESQAKRVSENRKRAFEAAQQAKQVDIINENKLNQQREADKRAEHDRRAALGLSANIEDGQQGPKEIPFIVKADVVGSAEAVKDCIEQIGNDEVKASVLYSAVGEITESDVFRAEAADGSIVAFSTNIPRSIERLAEQRNVPIRRHDVIYKAMEEISAKLSSLLSPIITRKVVSVAEIRAVFTISLKKKAQMKVAGIKVSKGSFTTSLPCQVVRSGKVIYEGTLSSIQHGKDQTTEAHKGSEYGVGFSSWSNFEEGDTIEGYEEIKTPRYI